MFKNYIGLFEETRLLLPNIEGGSGAQNQNEAPVEFGERVQKINQMKEGLAQLLNDDKIIGDERIRLAEIYDEMGGINTDAQAALKSSILDMFNKGMEIRSKAEIIAVEQLSQQVGQELDLGEISQIDSSRFPVVITKNDDSWDIFSSGFAGDLIGVISQDGKIKLETGVYGRAKLQNSWNDNEIDISAFEKQYGGENMELEQNIFELFESIGYYFESPEDYQEYLSGLTILELEQIKQRVIQLYSETKEFSKRKGSNNVALTNKHNSLGDINDTIVLLLEEKLEKQQNELIEKLQQENNAQNLEMKLLNKEIGILNDSLNVAENRILNLNDKLVLTTSRIQELSEVNKRQTNQINNIQLEIKSLGVELVGAHSDIALLQEGDIKKDEEIKQLQDGIQSYLLQIEGLENRLDELLSDILKQGGEIAVEQGVNDKQTADITELKTAVTEQGGEIAMEQGVNENQAAEIEGLKTAVAEQGGEIAMEQGINDKQTADITELKIAVSEQEGEIAVEQGVNQEQNTTLKDAQVKNPDNQVDIATDLENEQEETIQYTVKSGDTLWKIVKENYQLKNNSQIANIVNKVVEYNVDHYENTGLLHDAQVADTILGDKINVGDIIHLPDVENLKETSTLLEKTNKVISELEGIEGYDISIKKGKIYLEGNGNASFFTIENPNNRHFIIPEKNKETMQQWIDRKIKSWKK